MTKEDLIRELTLELRSSISDAVESKIEEYLYHGEWGCAVYLLWVALSENSQSVTNSIFVRLQSIALTTDNDLSILRRDFPLNVEEH